MSEPPERFKKQQRLKGCRAKGRTYERLVGRRIKEQIAQGEIVGELVSGQWFSFDDENGWGYAQTDHYIICPGFIILLECKLSQSEYADDQMTKLYEPLLRHIYKVPVITVQVFKNVRAKQTNAIRDLKDLIRFPKGGIFTWHYLG